MEFPYGLSDFATLIHEGYFYQDRTDRISLLEKAGRQLIFIRPRRFGKSLLLSMLEHYYDVNQANQFEALFGTRLPTNANSLYDIGFHSLAEWWHELGTGRVSRFGVGRCAADP
ncbi:MAG: AAA family ATPase, partial [Candidatus Contendobacter sp.]